MLFLSNNNTLKKSVMESFLLDRPGKNLVIFRDETEIPIQKGGINLYAPGSNPKVHSYPGA